ncbi:MAG: hypothetical protein IT280_13055 [Ignavibacteria bacterium]|nr:hypothetical protein [Ignavibacteria bacterium]
MRRVKNLQYVIIPQHIYAGSIFHGFIFTTGLKAYVKKGNITRRIDRGYFVKFLEMIAGLNEDQASELLRAEYIDNNIKWEV